MENTVMKQPLNDFVVLDLSLDTGGLYCTKLLADLGATVILIEPEEGHPFRHVGPFPDDLPHIEKSGSFLYFAANKKSICLDLTDSKNKKKVLDLAAGSDLVVETFKPGHIDSLGLSFDVLKSVNNSVVLASITHFGQTGPYRNWEGEAIIDFALGGYMYLGGSAEREPLMLPGNQAQLHAGVQAAIGSLAALWWARKTGTGQHVDVSAMEAMVSAHCWTSSTWTHEGVVMKRGEPDCIPCKDGWVFFMTLRLDPNIFRLVDRPELIDDPMFADRQSWIDNKEEIVKMLTDWCRDRTREEIFRIGQERLIPVTPVNDIDDLMASPQLEARKWFQKIEHPTTGTLTFPGFPYHLSRTPASIRSAAPLLDQDAGFVLKRETGKIVDTHDRIPIEPFRSTGKKLPLAGIRVLEVTANWAGPLACRYLADLGAEVIKIEPSNLLLTRAGVYAGGQTFRYHYNRSPYFNKINRNKYGVTLNMADPRGREKFLRLARETDVVVENNSPRVVRKLNLEYPVLRETNPAIIMASISGFGHTGPEKDYLAYGANIEASCGLASLTGYPDDKRPYRSSLFYADPIAAGHAAVAILAALFYKSRTGQGQHIDLSLQENGIVFFSESVIQRLVTGRTPEKLGNRHPRHAPQGCYPSAGDDTWLVMCVRSDDEWNRFCSAIGRPELTQERRFLTVEDRKKHHTELDSIISNWSSTYDHNEAAGILQKAGISAAPVLANWELVSNPHLHERGFYIPVVHREMGVFPYPGMPWKLSETPGLVRLASPCFGEHNKLIFKDLLNLPTEELNKLYRDGIIADAPPDEAQPPFRFYSM